MGRNEDRTCREVIEPALHGGGWPWDRHLPLGPGPVNIAGGSMDDETQRLAAGNFCSPELAALRESNLREAFAGNL